jgi:hydrogenase maturation factor
LKKSFDDLSIQFQQLSVLYSLLQTQNKIGMYVLIGAGIALVSETIWIILRR